MRPTCRVCLIARTNALTQATPDTWRKNQQTSPAPVSKFDELYRLHRLLDGRRTGLPRSVLIDEHGFSRSTLARLIADLRDRLGAPLIHDSERGGYRYDTADGSHALPGLWFTPNGTARPRHAEAPARKPGWGIPRTHGDEPVPAVGTCAFCVTNLIIRARCIAPSSNRPNDIGAYQSCANWAIPNPNPNPTSSRDGIFPSKQHLASSFAHA